MRLPEADFKREGREKASEASNPPTLEIKFSECLSPDSCNTS